MKNIKAYVLGVLSTLMVIGLVGTGYAAYQKQATLDYVGVKITLDGQEITPTDANGNAVEPFIMDGTTYLPVRGIANALGLGVEWNAESHTVALSRGSQAGSSSGTVIFEQNGLKVTFLGFAEKTNGLKGYDIKLKIENNSSVNYTVQVRDLSVNGIMADSIFSCEIAAGKAANDAIWITNMEERGITPPITEAEFKIHAFNTDTWDGQFESEVINVK